MVHSDTENEFLRKVEVIRDLKILRKKARGFKNERRNQYSEPETESEAYFFFKKAAAKVKQERLEIFGEGIS